MGTERVGTPRWHSLDAEGSLEALGSSRASGLEHADAAERLREYGTNELGPEQRHGLASIVLAQFLDFMILVLLAAAIVSGLLGDLGDALAIVVIVALNAIVGAAQEYRAERALAALRRLSALEATVVRGGERLRVPARELVPGDLVHVGAGDVVPADLRLLESRDLHTDESALTGESQPVAKHAHALEDQALAPGDRLNIAFKSTSVTKGRAVGVVVGTGLRTEIGRIARLLAERESTRTPLQQRLAVFGRRLALGVLAICAAIFVLGLATGQPPLLMFLTAVSLAVAAIPEALPAVVTVALAIGARKMSRRQALVRRLPAVESLGSVTYICADKTGTLTENRMTATAFHAGGTEVARLGDLAAPLRMELAHALALCNEIRSRHERSSDPTETALLEAARSAGFEKTALLERLPEIGSLAFDAERKLMTTLHGNADGAIAYTKGAPEGILARCTGQLAPDGSVAALDRAAAERAIGKLAESGHRVLALARRTFETRPTTLTSAACETELTLLGLVGLEDPLRPEVPRAIADCLSAGITPVMITGDHPATALKVGRELGLVEAAAPVLTGKALDELDDAALYARIETVRVYARVSPEQKIRIVEALQRAGELVAMTGDGVNDAPALKQASIGVAMGRRGTDVARETADMVLLDDNFATIVAAVREGRRVYDNIRKFIKYTMTSNSGEIQVLLLAPLLGLPIPLLPIQILWVNLVTDGLPGLAFSAEPAERNVMRRPPRPPRETVFARGLWQHMLWVGLLIAGLSLLTSAAVDLDDLPRWQTMVFTTLVTAQLFNALAVRSETDSLWRVGLFSNRYMLGAVVGTLAAQLIVVYVPILNGVFATVPLAGPELALCLGLGAAVLPVIELGKWLARRRGAR